MLLGITDLYCQVKIRIAFYLERHVVDGIMQHSTTTVQMQQSTSDATTHCQQLQAKRLLVQ